MVNIDQIKELREQTGVSISECKKALEQAQGDLEAAKEILKDWGKELARKRTGKDIHQGIIESYIHQNKKIGVLLELGCETDFVAKSPDFQNLAHELCLQIAALESDIPLPEQPWIKDESKSIKDLINGYIAKLGENIAVKKFVRYQI